MTHKYFQCFRCGYHNHFNNIPYYVKGKYCRRCHVFNYFNYHPKRNKNRNERTTQTTRTTITQPNSTLSANISNANTRINSNQIKNQNSLLSNQNRISSYYHQAENLFNFSNISSNTNISIFSSEEEHNNYSPNYSIPRIRLSNNISNNSIFNNNSISNNSNNNNIFNNINILNDNTSIYNNLFSLNNLHNYNQNNNIETSYNHQKFSWLKKEKYTQDISKNYEKDPCSICYENFKLNEEINITKCKHIFHYNCIEKAINKNILDCPICRSNLKTGEKKRTVNLNYNNIFNYRDGINYNNYRYNIQRDNSLNNERNNYEINRNRNENSKEGNFIIILIVLFIFVLALSNSSIA